jgi:hypothetical protein
MSASSKEAIGEKERKGGDRKGESDQTEYQLALPQSEPSSALWLHHSSKIEQEGMKPDEPLIAVMFFPNALNFSM